MDNNDFQNTVERYKQEMLDMASKQKLSNGENTNIYETYEEFLKENPENGKLKIQASTARGAIPIPNVHITVSKNFKDGKKIFFEGQTNSSGIIDNIELPAPDRNLSESPSDEIPYSNYDILATHPEYTTEEYINANIFDGITSIQPINLVPKSINND